MFPIHGKFPRLMPIIGRLLVDYADLEVDLMNCVMMQRGPDLNGTLKAMYRVRGETNRVDIADGLGRAPFVALGMASDFDSMIAAMRHTLRIRNKYAHALWHDPGKELCYVSLEEQAKESEEVVDLTALRFFYIDEPLLLSQERFFLYTRDLITYVNYEGQYQAKIIRTRNWAPPAVVAPPPYYTRASKPL
jgi:hypothetical protein